MRYNVTVDVPYQNQLPYSLFAKGSLIDIPHIDKDGKYVHFKFRGGTVFVLFYTFKSFRRAYVVTGFQNENDGEAINLPGVSEKLCLIFTAGGRKIDELKRVLYILTEEQNDEHKAFSLPLIFWYRLSALIQQKKALRSDIGLLWERFTKKKLVALSKKEKAAIRVRRNR